MADAYGSGPYGETRGGSTPLVSTPSDEGQWPKSIDRRREKAQKNGIKRRPYSLRLLPEEKPSAKKQEAEPKSRVICNPCLVNNRRQCEPAKIKEPCAQRESLPC